MKEDWNHDFGNTSSHQEVIGLEQLKSNATISLTSRSEIKELENLSKDVLFPGDSKCRSPSLCRLKNTKSGFDPLACNDNDLFLKELRSGTIGSKKNSVSKTKIGVPEHLNNFLPGASQMNFLVNNYLNGMHSDELADSISPELLYLPLKQSYKNQCAPPASNNKISKQFGESQKNNVPVKKKIDLYINTPIVDSEVNFKIKSQRKQNQKVVTRTMGNVKTTGKVAESKEKIVSKKSSTLVNKKSQVFGASSGVKPTNKSADVVKVAKKIVQSQTAASKKSKICRKSQSCDKPLKKISKERVRSKGCLSTKSLTKIEEDVKRFSERKLMISSQKRKATKVAKSISEDGTKKREENLREVETKARRKLKKRSSTLSKSVIYTDSPYSVGKFGSKTLDKGKIGQRKMFKEGEAKVDGTGRCRKSSTTKIS